MLLEFSVENFLSIKERVTFSMIASKDKSNPENIMDFGKINLLKSAAIYGANASGKSNLVKALVFVDRLVRNSSNKAGEKIKGLVPFKLDEDCQNKPSSFEIIFIKNGIRYVYKFSADATKIYEESLFYYPQQKKARIFERSNTNIFKFSKDKGEQKKLAKRTLDNSLYLTSSANWNYALTKEAFDWFTEKFRFIRPDSGQLYTANLLEEKSDLSWAIKDFLLQADIGIIDVSATVKDVSEDTIPKEFPESLKTYILNEGGKITEVKTYRIGKDKEGKEKKIMFEMEEESDGTQKMFDFAGPFSDVLTNGRFLVIDELDIKLHPLLTRYLVELFHNSERNKNGAQIVFTAHDTNLLGSGTLRRDQIWFTAKRSDQSTELYSLYEYKARKDEDVEKRYLMGRYGAIPLL